jgi:TRAP-type C4-dicarboxylate transport system permease small subunit
MQTLGKACGIAFGTVMIALSLVVTVETIIRKVFSISLGGVDELSGYAIAIGAPLAFAVASIEQSHIRINLLYMKLPRLAQAVLNTVAAISIGVLAVFFLYFSVSTLTDTIAYRSIAQTPWATPLVYPQSIWVATGVVFAAVAVFLGFRSLCLLIHSDTTTLVRSFGPERVEDEVAAELEDLQGR